MKSFSIITALNKKDQEPGYESGDELDVDSPMKLSALDFVNDFLNESRECNLVSDYSLTVRLRFCTFLLQLIKDGQTMSLEYYGSILQKGPLDHIETLASDHDYESQGLIPRIPDTKLITFPRWEAAKKNLENPDPRTSLLLSHSIFDKVRCEAERQEKHDRQYGLVLKNN